LSLILLAIRSPGAIAAITAGAAVLGALVGGAISGGTTYAVDARRRDFDRSEHQRDEWRDRERELVMVRGAARIWAGNLTRCRGTLVSTLQRGSWLSEDVHLTTRANAEIPYEDLKLIASFLTTEDWLAVRSAIRDFEHVVAFRQISRQNIAPSAYGPDLDEHDREVTDVAVTALGSAVRVLDALGAREPEIRP